VRAVLVLLAAAMPAAADPLERIDTVGAISAMTADGRPSTGLVMRVVLLDRLALAAQARTRDGTLIENLDVVFQLTHGSLSSTFGSRPELPIRFDVIAGAGVIQDHATASYGMLLRIRASRRITLDVTLRDEVSHATRPDHFTHTPEVQIALSWTAPRFRAPLEDDPDIIGREEF
jgi:hypothetical protein